MAIPTQLSVLLLHFLGQCLLRRELLGSVSWHLDLTHCLSLEEHSIQEAVHRADRLEVLVVVLGASCWVDANIVAFAKQLQQAFSQDTLLADGGQLLEHIDVLGELAIVL